MAVNTTPDKRLLEPISTVTSIALRVITAFFVAGRLIGLFQGSFGSRFVCLTDTSSGGSVGDERFSPFSPAPGASVDYVPRYCVDHPSGWQQALDQVDTVLSAGLLIGGLFLLDRTLRGAAREGIHTRRTAARFGLLGRWLLFGSLLAALGKAFAQGALLDAMQSDGQFASAVLARWDTPWLALLTGLGLLTFARIVRAGAALRADLEGVV
ncbi:MULTISPECIES: hypothetical protein [Streptomyces]|uniref:DUF2975 domain-containing protein n=1 Tax=Streptomyces evansiae TaxID=3075535 RepID=A0ABU2QUG1_9ACTN|nr:MULTISPECIES: hypothetical protein [unclassified Streptomyces]MDT0408084.1 hypothetical protein [Streptomyces sp. DSM 41979]MYQ56318.1 hypothetical protein [Streptomyces sp. SID4926]SCE55103.1 hypothetical protein GA0115252_162410 [Streptomyces sp. DfronAA-171]